MGKIKVAVIGYGHLGKWHCQKVEAHSDQAEFVAIVEKFPSGQEAARGNHPQVKVVSDIKDIINEIDAAFVVTPTSTHFELVSYLLENGKHVFCEKPVCSNDVEGMKLKLIAEKKNLVLQVGHSERFHEAWDILKDKLKNLPTPYTIRINRVAAFKGRATDVDVVQDLAIHDLDLLMFLFNSAPVVVNAHGFKIRTEKWDHASIQVEMEKGCSALITVGRNHVKEIRDVEILSKEGTIYIDLFHNKIMEANSSQFADNCFVKETSYQKRDHLLLEHGLFYRSILDNRPAVVNLQDGLNAVHLVDCSLKSMDQKAPVKVSFHA